MTIDKLTIDQKCDALVERAYNSGGRTTIANADELITAMIAETDKLGKREHICDGIDFVLTGKGRKYAEALTA